MAEGQERPRLENYRDYNQFLVDMATYKKRLREQPSQPNPQRSESTSKVPAQPTVLAALSPQPVPQVSAPATPRLDTIDPASEEAPPPLSVSGPEDLDYAVSKAKDFPHPVYKVTRRYNRSTAQSFPLPQLESQDLEGSAVANSLNGPTAMPDNPQTLSRALLEEQAKVALLERELSRSARGARHADEDEKESETLRNMVKIRGMREATISTIIQPVYIPGVVRENGAVIGITIYPSKTETTFNLH